MQRYALTAEEHPPGEDYNLTLSKICFDNADLHCQRSGDDSIG